MMGFEFEMDLVHVFEPSRTADVVQKLRGFFAMKKCRELAS
jgi:hypothetical protein